MRDYTVLTRLKADVDHYVRGMGRAAVATRSLFNEVDKTNDRTAWLAQGLLAIGPALVPIGAAAVPAMAGLTAQMGLAASAAGVTAVAMVGVGDGLKALNAYQLEPSAKNLAKVREEFDKLGPAGVEFVEYLDGLSSQLRTIRDEAREEMFPGVVDGIDSMMERLPEVRNIVGEIAGAMGDLTEEAGQALASSRFDDLFDYFEENARPLLLDLSRTMGNLIDGFSSMMMALDPLTQRFSDGFLGMSQDFADWARGLEDNRSFQEFVDYVIDAMPDVKAFIGSVIDAFVALVQAAAPVGDVMLPFLEALFDTIAAIAETPLGPVFIALGAAISVYGRAAAAASLFTEGFGKSILGLRAIDGVKRGFTTSRPSIEQWGTSIYRAGQGAKYQTDETKKAMAATRQFGRAVGPAAGALGLLAVSASDVDDKLGLSNTAMNAAIGMMLGPWGAAAGAAIGFGQDLAAANDEVAASLEAVGRGLRDQPTALAENGKLFQQATEDLDNYRQTVEDGLGALGSLATWQNNLEEIFGRSELDERSAEWDRYNEAFQDTANTAGRLSVALSGFKPETASLSELEQVLQSAAPAMDDLGISLDMLNDADPEQFDRYADSIRRWLRNQDSVRGRTRSVADAIKDLENDMLSTVDSADQLAVALEALLGPGLSAEEAFDAYKTALREMRKELKDIAEPFEGFSKAAMKNREVTRGVAEDTIAMLTKQAEAGASSEKLARLLREARREFIREGIAAGLSADEIRRRANQLGLTPRLVRTVLEAVGIDEADKKLAALQDRLKRYGLTTSTARAALNDVASGRIKTVQGLIDKYDITKAEAKALLQDEASGKIDAVRRKLRDLNGEIAEAVIRTRIERIYRDVRLPDHLAGHRREADGGIIERFADGGFPRIGDQDPQLRPYTGPRGIMWSEEGSGPWEAFISGHPHKKDRSRAIADDVVSRLGGETMWFANGGIMGQVRQTAAPVSVAVSAMANGDVARIAQALAHMRSQYGDVHVYGDGSFERHSRARRALGSAS